jgi:hypothetical protein
VIGRVTIGLAAAVLAATAWFLTRPAPTPPAEELGRARSVESHATRSGSLATASRRSPQDSEESRQPPSIGTDPGAEASAPVDDLLGCILRRNAPEGVCLISELEIVELQEGRDCEVELVVEPCLTVAVELRVLDPTAGWKARVLDAERWPVLETRWFATAPASLLLPRGDYRLLVLDAQGAVRAERPFTADVSRQPIVVEVLR